MWIIEIAIYYYFYSARPQTVLIYKITYKVADVRDVDVILEGYLFSYQVGAWDIIASLRDTESCTLLFFFLLLAVIIYGTEPVDAFRKMVKKWNWAKDRTKMIAEFIGN